MLKNNINMNLLNAAIMAAFCHDVNHPGVTNKHLVLTRDKIARRYNDISVLENMH